jgi:hypothetical protein
MKRSNHYGDIIQWIEKVIESCQNIEQLKVAKKLVTNFEHKLDKDSPSSTNIILTSKLTFLIQNKKDELRFM